MELKTEEVTVRVLKADDGKEFVRIEDGYIMGKEIYLGCEDSPMNYLERNICVENSDDSQINA